MPPASIAMTLEKCHCQRFGAKIGEVVTENSQTRKLAASEGIVFELTGAAASFVAHGDDPRELIAPVVLAGLAVAPWALRLPSRSQHRT